MSLMSSACPGLALWPLPHTKAGWLLHAFDSKTITWRRPSGGNPGQWLGV